MRTGVGVGCIIEFVAKFKYGNGFASAMHRVTGATWTAAAVGLFAVFMVAGFAFGTIPLTHSAAGPAAASSARSTTHAAPSIAPAGSYATSINLTLISPVDYSTVSVPTNVTFSTNITAGAISSSATKVWVNVTGAGIDASLVSGKNFTINTSAVVVYNNNGILYSNYTWSAPLNAANLGCSKASCADVIPGGGTAVLVNVTVLENGASFGGGWASAMTAEDLVLASTFAYAGLSTIAPYSEVPLPATVTVWTNISWGATTNATTNVTLWWENATAVSPTEIASWIGAVNTTNATTDTSSSIGFAGTAGGIYWSYATWTAVLNQTTLGCSTATCNTTFGQGIEGYLTVVVNENGTSVGGTGWTGDQIADNSTNWLGTTFASGGDSNYPADYQGLPFTGTGWLNISYSPSVANGNSTITGFVQVWDLNTFTLLKTLSANSSVNTTNSAGFSLIPYWAGSIDGPGIPYVNYTWSLALSTSNLGASFPYDPIAVILNLTVDGSGSSVGGVNTTITPGAPYAVLYDDVVLAANPTTVAQVFPALPGYVPVYEPYTQTINITTNTAINATTVSMTANIIDETLTAELGVLDVVSSTSIAIADNVSSYAFPISSVALTCSTPVCVYLSQLGYAPGATDVYALNVTTVVDGIGGPTNGTIAMAYDQSSFFAIFAPVSAVLTSPNPGPIIPPGNVTVSVTYSGSFISGVLLDIYSPTGALVFAQSFTSSGQNATWLATSPGTYTAAVIVTTAYTTPQYFNASLTIAKVPKIYVNSTQYTNSTLIPGLSAAGAGTLLLVIGLIIGMIVALLLGRAVWGGRQAPQSPQPWESQGAAGAAGAAGGAAAGSTTGAGGTNVCSVCGKAFGSPEELAAHQKSEHGME